VWAARKAEEDAARKAEEDARLGPVADEDATAIAEVLPAVAVLA